MIKKKKKKKTTVALCLCAHRIQPREGTVEESPHHRLNQLDLDLRLSRLQTPRKQIPLG
jgi:hypothetical protein